MEQKHIINGTVQGENKPNKNTNKINQKRLQQIDWYLWENELYIYMKCANVSYWCTYILMTLKLCSSEPERNSANEIFL